MLLDTQLILDNNVSLAIAAPGQPSAFTIDLMGVGVGQAPPNYFGVQDAVFGQDIGIGDGMSPPNILCVVTTAFTAAGAATLQVQLQEAPDTGANTGTPGTYLTIAQTDTIAVATLTKGLKIAEFTIPPKYPGQTTFPRFYRLNYVVATGPMLTGAITAAIITGRDDQPAYPANF